MGPLFGFLDLFANCFGRQPARSRGLQYWSSGNNRCGGWPLSAPLFLSATTAGGGCFWWRGGLVAPFGQGVRANLEAGRARGGIVTKWSDGIRRIEAPGICSFQWRGDDLVDWVDGGSVVR